MKFRLSNYGGKGGYSAFAEYYDELMDLSGADYGAIAEYYKTALEKHGLKGKLLLDAACGTGRLTRRFAEFGFDVIGVDVSAEMLNKAMQKPNANIQYIRQDLTALDLFGTVDAAVMALDSFNHLNGAEAAEKVLERISFFMNDGGILAFDANTVYKHSEILADNCFVLENENLYAVWQNFKDGGFKDGDNSARLFMELDIFSKESNFYKRSRDSFYETAYQLAETEKMLERTGFRVLACYDWLTFAEASERSEKAVFIAQKTNKSIK